ncbi:MAG: ABC transporter permease [Deltaproteobacteria bacterium]|nr:ABC transporter permease [Deltaproteobacteria bacterium]
MDLVRTWAVFRKELIHIKRDPSSLAQAVLLPVVLLFLYGYALTFDINRVPTAVFDREGSQISRDFINSFAASRYFSMTCCVSSYGEIDRLINSRRVWVALILPHDFSRQIKSGQTARVQVIVDGTDANTANIVIGYIQSVTAAYNDKVAVERLQGRGLSRLPVEIKNEPRVWFNEELESKNFIVPGLIVVIMTMVGSLLTALTIVREGERGSLEGLFATPLKKWELIAGKLGPYFIIGMVDMFIALGMGVLLFDVPLRGSPVLLILLSALFLIVMLGQGLLISVLSINQLQAYQMATLLTFLPAFLLSGFVFAIAQMPLPLRLVSYLVPSRYFVTISKGIYLKGTGLYILWPEVVLLFGFAAFFLIAAQHKFVKKIR